MAAWMPARRATRINAALYAVFAVAQRKIVSEISSGAVK